MNPRHLELADEFGRLVGAPDLLEYLGLDDDATREDARAALKQRRRYLQGMQSNPKFKREAVFLIKHFAAFDNLLADLDGYRRAVRRQKESAQLPILEVAIRTALKAGPLSPDQETYLRETARELGVSTTMFERTLGRLAQEAGIPLADDGDLDFFRVLGVPPDASTEAIHAAYTRRIREIAGRPDSPAVELERARLDRAWGVLSDPKTRAAYERGRIRSVRHAPDGDTPPAPRTGPAAPTAPPVRPRSITPMHPPPVPAHTLPGGTLGLTTAEPPHLEILGDPMRRIRVRPGSPHLEEIHLRNASGKPLQGRVSVDEPWMTVRPTTLDPRSREQIVAVTIDPDRMPGSPRTGVVTIQTERGDRASIAFEVTREASIDRRLAWIGIGLTVVAIVVAAVLLSRQARGAIGYDGVSAEAPREEAIGAERAP